MSGPALRRVESHSSIHEAMLNEAEELTKLLASLLKNKEMDKALEVALIIVEHWETRTLQHAKSEEEGLFKEMVKTHPKMNDSIIALKRDHDLLRQLVTDINHILETDGANEAVLQRFQALILVDQLHNQMEEKVLPEH